MNSPRRRVIRPVSPPPTVAASRLPRLRSKLEREQHSLTNWTAKLKRAFHNFEKYQLRITRLQRQIRNIEEV